MISVCMATYNGQKYIKEQITSILEQLGGNDELVISDDQSTDSTLDIIKSFNDERIKVFVKSEKVTTDFPSTPPRTTLPTRWRTARAT